MATFPGIQYSERTPSGRTGAVPLPMQVDTGAQAIAQGIMNVGLAFGEIGQKAKQAQDAMNLSVVERDKDMLSNATIEELKKSKTAEDAEKIIEAFKAKGETLASKHSPEVQRAYTINFNNNFGQTDMVFRATASAAWAKDAKDQFDYALQKAVESGDELSAYIVLSKARATEIIGEQEYARQVESVPRDMIVASLKKRAYSNPQQAALEAETYLKTGKGFTAQQQSHLLGIVNLSKGVISDQEGEFTKDISNQMQKANLDKNFGAVDRLGLATQLHAQVLRNSNLTGTQAEVWHAHIDRWAAGTTLTKSDPDALAAVSIAVNDLRYGRSTEKQVTDLINSNRPLLSDKDYATYSGRAHTNLNQQQTDFINKGLADLRMELGGPDIDREDGFRFEMEDWLDTHKEASEKDRFVAKKSIYTKWRDVRQAEVVRMSAVPNVAIPSPQTQAEYDAIPSGMDYIDTDGVRKRKR